MAAETPASEEPLADKGPTLARMETGEGLPDDVLSPDARDVLHRLFRTCTLKHDQLGQEILLNHLLRNYLHHNLFDQASRLIGSVKLQQPYRSNNQAARFYYYDALIKATKLDYNAAQEQITNALRKSS